MSLKNLPLLVVMILSFHSLSAQTSPIDSIATKYRNWLTDTTVDYARPEINQRYSRFLTSGNGARNLAGYDLATPGPVWDLTIAADQNAYMTLVEQKLIRLVFLYQLKGPVVTPNPNYHSITLRDTILSIFNYIKVKGVNSTTNLNTILWPALETIEIYKSIDLRCSAYATAIFLMKEELVAAGAFNDHMGALNNMTSFIAPGNPNFNFTYPGFNTDVIRSTLQQRLCYVLAQNDTSSSRIPNMAFLSNFISNSLLTGYGWYDCIKPDGITYHHIGPYANTYGVDALQVASILNLVLKNTAYPLSAAAEQNVKRAVLNYRKFSIDFTMPRGLAGRFPTNTASLDALRPALAYLYLADPVANADAGQEFVRLWNISSSANLNLQRANISSVTMVNSMGGMQDMVNTLNAGLAQAAELTEGQFNFPYGGLSVHKYNGWQASMKGTSKIIWHYENSATENLFGAYTSAGAMELLTLGSPTAPDSNGLTFNGWDWAHIPGTTVANVPYAAMANFTMRQMDGKDFLAHAALGNNGVFAMDYKDTNSATGMTALKTAFFFKDKILCLGSNIKDAGGIYPIHTTLFQTSFGTGNTSLVNGNTVSGNTYTLSQPGGSTLWATDAAGNGFVVPASPYNTGSIAVQRASQTSPNQSNTANTTGNFSKAYIDHGTAPSAGSYQYAVIMQGGSATQDLANNFTAYFQVLKQDSQAHIVKFVPDSVYSYVIWDTSAVLPTGLMQRVNKPSVIMMQQTNGGNQVNVSLTNPNMGLLASGENYTYSQIEHTASRLYRIPQTDVVSITLQGAWQVDASTPNPNVSVAANGMNTDVLFSTKNGLTEQTTLLRTVPLLIDFPYLKVYTEGCATVLTWKIEEDIKKVKSIGVERSYDGRSWTVAAWLQPDVSYYRDEAGPALYRLGVYGHDNACTYSRVLQSQSQGCPDQSAIKVYPNPVAPGSSLTIVADKINDVRVFDAFGHRLWSGQFQAENQVAIPIGKWVSGIYTIRINGDQVRLFLIQ